MEGVLLKIKGREKNIGEIVCLVFVQIARPRISGIKVYGKVYGKKVAQYSGNQPDEGIVVTSWDTAAAENEDRSSCHTHRKSKSIRLAAGGKGESEEGKQPAAHEKRTCTTRQATQTQPALLAELLALHRTQGGNVSLFDGGKPGGHGRADSRRSAARALSSH